MSYDPAADRLVGGDYVRELPKGWARSFLMTAVDGQRIRHHLQELDTAYREENGTAGDTPVPYPRALAVISLGGLPGTIDGRPQLVPLDLAFAGTPLRSAPPAYRDVVQLVCAVHDPTTLAEQRPDTAPGRRQFAVNLFGVLRCAHRRLYLALTRNSGSSVDVSTVSPAGHLQDPYYLVGPGDLPGGQLRRGQQQDLIRALSLAIGLGGGRDTVHGVLVEAVITYWRTVTVPLSMSDLIDPLTADRRAPEAVAELAAALLSDGW